MKLHKLPLDKIGQFSNLFVGYVNQKQELEKFYDLYPTPENFITQAKASHFSSDNRKVLYSVLQKQYEQFSISSKVKENIGALLKENSFTVTTGHQLNLFTGPLYCILKIATVIDACKKLNQQQSALNFIPVFWMASEDHDVEEINHFHLFGKKHSWETEQKGPVGRFSTAGIEKIFPEIKDKLPLLEKAYLEHSSLADATRYLMNELFGEYGLVILDGDSVELKSQCKELFKKELLQRSSKSEVETSTDALKKLDYDGQVYPREINLFYMETGLRERIVFENGVYKVNATDKTFTEAEILTIVDTHPERISPNVILRPVYQELVLPNVAYCGGPAEVGYWFQLKSLFDSLSVPFPILLPRAFAMIIQKAQVNRMQKLELTVEQLFQDERILKEQIVLSGANVDYTLEEEDKEVELVFEKVKGKASIVDPTLEAFVLAEGQKVKKILEQIGKRLKKAEEQKHEVVLNQLSTLKSKLFPDGQLQERKDNFLNFYTNNPAFINEIVDGINSFDLQFTVFIEHE